VLGTSESHLPEPVQTKCESGEILMSNEHDQFTGRAQLPDGTELTMQGTIMECANWADNVIRANGICNIDIRIIKQEG
jgi:hypothetical protein